MNKIEKIEKKLNELSEELKKLKEEDTNYEIVKYANREWYVIKKDNDKVLLLSRYVLSKEEIEKYFFKELIDEDGDIVFSPESSNKWCDSSIRMCLNGKFLENFDLNDLVKSELTIKYSDGKEITTRDYIRLLTKEEAEELPDDIRKADAEYGYWLLTPHSASAHSTWYVNSTGYVYAYDTGYGRAVRPAVEIKSSVIK